MTGGVLFISDSLFQENHAGSSAGAVWAEATNNWIGGSTFISNTAQEYGGALISINPLSMARTTFSGNSAEKSGGGLEVLGLATLINSTVSGNTAGYGGGISLVDNGVLNLNRVTVSHNIAITAGGGISLTAGSTAYVLSTIIANNVGDDCAGRNYFNDLRYNLIEDGSCITDSTSISGDPNLGPLADNGGNSGIGYPLLTHALLPGSPAVDHVPNGQNSCGSAGVTDQRGVTRPQGSGCDIGAFEAAILPLNVTVVGSGSVSGPGINCGVDCSESFYENTVITLTASANAGFILAGWSGDCSGTADCIITMDAAKNVTATFAEPAYEIFISIVIKDD
jgi:predicted outer membrane repeat protein